MNSPLRKEMDKELTTADIAQGNREEEREINAEQRDVNSQQRREPVDIGSARAQG